MKSRSLAAQHPAHRDDIGDLITRRPVPAPGLEQVDPFLFLNHHGPQVYRPGNNGLPFGPHPHRGFETVTIILQGSLAHHDSGGNASIIEAGGVQWMTAGSGLIHAEVSPPEFKKNGGSLEILQLWVNLPSRLKMTEPRYSGVQAESIPEIAIANSGGTLSLVAGTYGDAVGPIKSLTGVFMSTVRLPAGTEIMLPAPADRSVFLYVVSGRVSVSGTNVEPWHLVTFADDGDAISLQAADEALILFAHADPIREPVVAHGPFVMNSTAEIHQAIRDYQAGKFDGTGKLQEVAS